MAVSPFLQSAIDHLLRIKNRTPGQEDALREMQKQKQMSEALGPTLTWDPNTPSEGTPKLAMQAWLNQPYSDKNKLKGPNDPLYVTNKDYYNAIRSQQQALLEAAKERGRATGGIKIASDGKAELGTPSVLKHYRSITSTELATGNFAGPVTFTDIETGHYDKPISIAAVKGVVDKRTGEFRVLDTYERYYTPENAHSAWFNISRETHKLTPDKIAKLRAMQMAGYSETYNEAEAQSLMKFLRGSLIGGQNVEEFDFDRLGIASALQHEDIIDTLVAAENLGIKVGHRGLAKLFKRYTGMTMEQAGYSHHVGMHDVLANIAVYSAMYKLKNKTGRDIRFITQNRGYSYGKYEEHAGTAIIKGGYFKGRGKGGPSNYMYEDEFDESGVFEMDYDDNGQKKLPDGYSWSDELKEDGDPTGGVSTIMSSWLAQEFQALTEAVSKAKESTIGFKVQQQNQMIRYLAGKDEDIGRKFLKGLKYDSATIDLMMKQAIPLRWDKERRRTEKAAKLQLTQRQSAGEYLTRLYRGGKLGYNDWSWLSDVNNDTTGFSPKDIMSMARERADERKQKLGEIKAMRAQREAAQEEDLRKTRYLDRAERRRQIWGRDRENLDNLAYSYDDLVDATERVIDANQKLMKVYEAISSIKPYDINKFIASAKGQWSGVMGASRGVIPSFVRNPVSRLGDATFNAIDRSVSPWNAFNRTWNSGIGQTLVAAGGAFGGVPGMMIGGTINGTVNAISQVAGNYQQAKMEMGMLNIQNNLNTLGALISWISTPFQLLHKATKLLIGSFGGLTYKLNNLMAGGIGEMSQMGNPLEQMTGVDYLKYQGTTLMDLASLQSKGSTNAAIESFATMQRNLYRFGRVDTDKLLAANMLGVFNEAFTPTTDAVGSYYAMGNKILSNMQGQSASQQADTLYYVNQLNSGLAQTIRSALMMGVTDLRQLTDPSAFHQMYWRPITDTEEGAFRKTQYEYGVAGQQFGYTKMRFADKLWNAIGRDLYNGLNRLVDNAAEGDWKGVLEAAGDMWTTFKEKVKSVWDSLNAEGGIGDKISAGLSVAWDKIKEWGVNIARGIIDIWNQVFRTVLEKAQGLIAYLSTVQVKLVKGENGWGIDISTIKDAKDLGGGIYNGSANSMTGEYYVEGTNKGMKGFAALVDTVFPGMSDTEKMFMTRERLASILSDKDAIMAHNGMVTPHINLPQYNIHNLPIGEHPELVEPLLDYLAMYESSGSGLRGQAAAMLSPLLQPYLDKDATSIPGLMSTYDKFVDAQNEVLGTAASYIAAPKGDGDTKITFDFKLGDKTATATYTQGKGLTFTGMPLLQQVGLGNGISVSVSKQR